MIITVTPKIVILALFGGSRLCSVSGLWHPLDSQSGQSVVESEWGEVGECPLSASLLWSSGCRAAAPQRSTSSWAPLDRLSVWREKRILRDWPITALCRTHGISNRGPLPLDPAVILPSPPPPISQFFDTKITLAGRCNSHISGIFASVLCIFLEKIIWLFFFSFFQCVILLFLSTCSGLQSTGCWTSPSLFICRNTLVRGASVCSSCVLNAKWGSILQTVNDCLFVFNWSCFLRLTVFCSTSR